MYNIVNSIKVLCISCKFHLVGFIKEDLYKFKKLNRNIKTSQRKQKDKRKKIEKLFYSELILKGKEAFDLVLFQEVLKIFYKKHSEKWKNKETWEYLKTRISEKRLCSILPWIPPMELTYGLYYWYF